MFWVGGHWVGGDGSGSGLQGNSETCDERWQKCLGTGGLSSQQWQWVDRIGGTTIGHPVDASGSGTLQRCEFPSDLALMLMGIFINTWKTSPGDGQVEALQGIGFLEYIQRRKNQ